MTDREKYIKYKRKFYACVKERLLNSVHPWQARDFYFLTLPKNHPNAGREVPVDYLLKNIVKYFWDHKLITLGWDQGIPAYHGFITFDLKTTDGTDSLPIIKNIIIKIIGKQNIKILDDGNKNFESEEAITKFLEERNKLFDEYFEAKPKNIIIDIAPNFIGITFNHELIPFISKKLNLDVPSHSDALPGGLVDQKKYTYEEHMKNN